ncbi:MAG: C39 family peptidase [Candidatus Riflebacteria bacterium]|nr:C39 family peptidase [Candidatus Riflebacteria bacterium]
MKKSTNLHFLLIAILVLGSFIALSPGFAVDPFSSENTITVDQIIQRDDSKVVETETPPVVTVSKNEVIIAPVKQPTTDPEPAKATTEEKKEVAAPAKVTIATEAGYSKILEGYEEQSISIDGDNYCGQFAMSSVFKGLGIDKSPQETYKATNPSGIFTAPPVIVGYLNKNGVKAQQRQNCSLEDIAKKIDAGLPVMVLVDSGDGTPHWICIYGYTRDASGKIASVRMRDSYWGTSSGHEMDAETFTKAWKQPFGDTLIGKIAGYSNLMIDINGNSTWPATPFATATEDNMASGINEVVTGWTNRDWGQLAGGAAKLINGIPGAVISIGSRLPTTLGNSLTNWGKEKFGNSGIGNKLLGGAAIAGGSVLQAGGWVANQVGNAASSVAKAIGNGIGRLFGR